MPAWRGVGGRDPLDWFAGHFADLLRGLQGAGVPWDRTWFLVDVGDLFDITVRTTYRDHRAEALGNKIQARLTDDDGPSADWIGSNVSFLEHVSEASYRHRRAMFLLGPLELPHLGAFWPYESHEEIRRR